MAALVGAQAGAGVWALLKAMEEAARRSIFGVWISMPECPDKNPTQSFISSTAIKRMFCFSSVLFTCVLQLLKINKPRVITRS
jgi:hypothetical protein